jgi:hypothetical protein
LEEAAMKAITAAVGAVGFSAVVAAAGNGQMSSLAANNELEAGAPRNLF